MTQTRPPPGPAAFLNHLKNFVPQSNTEMAEHYSVLVRRTNIDAIRIKQLDGGFIPVKKKINPKNRFDEKIWEGCKASGVFDVAEKFGYNYLENWS